MAERDCLMKDKCYYYREGIGIVRGAFCHLLLSLKDQEEHGGDAVSI